MRAPTIIKSLLYARLCTRPLIQVRYSVSFHLIFIVIWSKFNYCHPHFVEEKSISWVQGGAFLLCHTAAKCFSWASPFWKEDCRATIWKVWYSDPWKSPKLSHVFSELTVIFMIIQKHYFFFSLSLYYEYTVKISRTYMYDKLWSILVLTDNRMYAVYSFFLS